MEMHSVNSSRISAVGWENDTLYVQFPDGKICAYDGVPYTEYLVFVNSSSLGRELSRIDKIYHYRYV